MSKVFRYTRSRSKYHVNQVKITEDYELQYNEKHIVEKVKVGETDLIKEVASHVDEVGLQNVIALAIAHGEDPFTKFGKFGSGNPCSIDPDMTKDDIEKVISSNSSKKLEIAKSLGISVEEFDQALNEGTLKDLITRVESAPKKEEGDTDGE